MLPEGGQLVEVTVPGRGLRPRRGIQLHQPRNLPPTQCTRRDGIPITTVARTLLDLAAVVEPNRLRRAFEAAERHGLFDLPAVERALEGAGNRKGVGRLRVLMHELVAPPDTRSELEERFTDLCCEQGLPPPALNCVVAGHTVDALWPRERLIVELDGFAFHRSREAFERDRTRDADLQLAGHRVIRVTARRLSREPEAVVRSIRALLGRSAPRTVR
jgi:hypothetical protein